ncbi:unnamed protein product [Rotaria magnacalcarata]|uniref:DDE-1 domain-containing protein n=2 Tax=Rotaria magnacalcarata TaxID=392030 RepID=A0A816NTL8_9BILA|nr:unnamed protein product [Rotaria magnacalcarata]CAF2039921.1 unnamed protein product [Rotaria magnacalcarata]CAF3956586.1 unnamed protein product [Rotaria magnacalcarata]
MVRNYIRKRNSSTYNEKELLDAIEKIRSDEWTYKEASQKTKISSGFTVEVENHTTVLLTTSADGTCLPPYIICKSLRLYDQWCPKNVISGAVYNGTESGWIDENCFYEYLSKSFIPKTHHIARPLLLILDNHSTHLSIRTAKLAIKHNVHILCLPSHSTHLLQPLDVYTFKYVKTQWRNLLWEFNKSSRNKTLDKPDFVKLFAKLYDYALLPAHCSPSLAKAGIFPYDPRIIRQDKLINNGVNVSGCIENQNSIQRSLSVEYESTSRNEHSISTTAKSNTLIRSSSAPNLCSADDALHQRSNNLLFLPCNTNVSERPVPSPVISLQPVVSSINNIPPIANETPSINQSFLAVATSTDVSLSLSSNDPLVSSSFKKSSEQDKNPLSAIKKIMEKFFTQTKTITNKKRMLSREFGTSITDLDELPTEKKIIRNRALIQKNRGTILIPFKTAVISGFSNRVQDKPRNVSAIQNVPFNNNFSTYHNTTTLQPLQNLTQMNAFSCHQCSRGLQSWEMSNNCAQCHVAVCWQCIGMNDASSFICYSCQNTNIMQQYSQWQ